MHSCLDDIINNNNIETFYIFTFPVFIIGDPSVLENIVLYA